jgi:hypothetical protein
VLLAGDWPTLKRPVRLPFLDFSTPRRHHFLQEELRRNQRTAPELYLGLVPSLAPGGTAWGHGPVIEWALRMFLGLKKDAETGGWCHPSTRWPTTWRAFTRRCRARAGAGASRRQPGRVATSPQRPADCTLDQVRAVAAPAWPAPPAQRQAAGWVRECHGDPHLGNWSPGKCGVLAFDALEFDSRAATSTWWPTWLFFMDLLAHSLGPGLAAGEPTCGAHRRLCRPAAAARRMYRALVGVALLSPEAPPNSSVIGHWRSAAAPPRPSWC